MIHSEPRAKSMNSGATSTKRGLPRYVIHCVIPDADELAAHRAYLDALAREAKAGCMWLELEREAATDVVLEVAVAA
jgi:hypothetical protein